ncbi:hypothetical protein K1W69_11795 [Hoeflea sp. WL0058]|uniref:Uncharacterized protein n=1 Tax=Flavimaribacter sediminis TaxID=2865987 RepID=A0AAE2ZNL3_9HYPH|nr:hypothetical protein [Flavimaribacter sediminis]MBW8637872.1 hypothetical protein [Flavimaribacter sediminis]
MAEGCGENKWLPVDFPALATKRLPALEMRSGSFQGGKHWWTIDETTPSEGKRFVAVSSYLACMTAKDSIGPGRCDKTRSRKTSMDAYARKWSGYLPIKICLDHEAM